MLRSRLLKLGTKSCRSIASHRKEFPPPNALYHEFLMGCMDRNSERTAVIDYVTKEALTHGQIGESIGQIANRLIEWGVKPGDHIGLSSFNHINYLPLQLGIMAAGGRAALCNPAYTDRETGQILKTGNVSRVIGHPKNSATVKNCAKRLGMPEPLDISLIMEESKHYSSDLPDIDMDVKDTCALFYSSGTTGFPKAVELTHNNFVSQLMILDDPQAFHFNVDTVNNGFLPLFHIFGSVVGAGVLHKGSTSIILDGFDPLSFLGAMQDYKVTFATVVPPIMVFLAKHPMVSGYDLSSLCHLISGAAPLSPHMEKEVLDRLGVPGLLIRQGYGLSETTAASHFLSTGLSKPGSIGGIANNTECKIIDVETGEECGPHRPGEVYLKGPCVMKGYYNNPEANAEVFTEDDFFKTGDIGYYDDEHDFYIVDRLKELIKVKGFQVPPAEIEALLLEHPLVADVAVIGIHDEYAGERPKAFVVKRPGSEVSASDIINFVREHASEYKVPAQVEFIDAVPKLPSGKIQRKVLRDAEKSKQ